MPKVSVIIPCYNQGHFLEEAVDSVLQQSLKDYEIIIVNDGSTEQSSQTLLAGFQKPYTQVIQTSNQGLASARNNGIAVATGQYILPLDADDRIASEYLEKAVNILDQQSRVGIVYCRAELFGAVETEWLLPDYSKSEMLKDNLIFCSAMFRRSDWELVGGYDPGMVYGWEDYEFWLSLIEKGREVYRIPEVLFAYRVASNSMVRSKERWQKVEMFKRIYLRHQKLYSENIDVWIDAILASKEQYFTSRLYVDCGRGISDEDSLSRKVEKGTSEIIFELDRFENIKALRFDPVDAPVVVEIFKFILCYKDGTVVTLVEYDDNALFTVLNDKYFDTDDSQVFLKLPINPSHSLSSVTVNLSFKALGEKALSSVVEQQKTMLNNSLQEKNNNGMRQFMKRSIVSFLRCGID